MPSQLPGLAVSVEPSRAMPPMLGPLVLEAGPSSETSHSADGTNRSWVEENASIAELWWLDSSPVLLKTSMSVPCVLLYEGLRPLM